MMENRKLLSNFIWNMVGSSLMAFNSLFFMIIITRINGLEDAGTFSITFATASIFYVFAVYSGRSCHTTDIEEKIKDKDYIISRIITCIITFILIGIFVAFNNYGNYKNIILVLLCIWRCLEAFSDVFYGIMQKSNNLDKVGKSLTIKSILGLVLFVIIDILTKNIIYACTTLVIVSIVVILVYDIPQSLKFIQKEEKIKLNNVKIIYKAEFFIFINSFLTIYLLNAPKYAIEEYLTESIQAIFGIILMPASILPLFAQFVVTPIINRIKNLYKQKNIEKFIKLQNKIILFIFIFGLVAVAIGYIIGIPVLELLYKTDLTQYKIPFIIILLAYIIYAMGYVKTVVLTIYRKIKEQSIVYIICSIVICVVSTALVKHYGIYGGAISYFITMLIYYLLFSIITRLKTKEKM